MWDFASWWRGNKKSRTPVFAPFSHGRAPRSKLTLWQLHLQKPDFTFCSQVWCQCLFIYLFIAWNRWRFCTWLQGWHDLGKLDALRPHFAWIWGEKGKGAQFSCQLSKFGEDNRFSVNEESFSLLDQSAAAITSFFCSPLPVVFCMSTRRCVTWFIHRAAHIFWEEHSEKLKACHWKKRFNLEENRRGSMLLESSPRSLLRFINRSNDASLYGHHWGEPCDFSLMSFKCNYHHLSKKRQSGVTLEVLKHLTWLQDGVMGSAIRVLVVQSPTPPQKKKINWKTHIKRVTPQNNVLIWIFYSDKQVYKNIYHQCHRWPCCCCGALRNEEFYSCWADKTNGKDTITKEL